MKVGIYIFGAPFSGAPFRYTQKYSSSLKPKLEEISDTGRLFSDL
ncbi:MAG: hypothetical protein ACI4DY_08730 [Monoglobaceae bacterium]